MAQRHIAGNLGHRLWPGFSLNSRLVAIVDEHFCWRLAVLRADSIRGLIDCPARANGCDFENGAIGIIEVDRLEVVAVQRAFNGNTQVYQPPFPFQQTIIVTDLHGEMMGTANTRMASRCIRPLEEGDDRAGMAHFIAKVEVIATGIIEINRLLHEAQS